MGSTLRANTDRGALTTMAIRDTIKSAKPFVFGLVVGIILAIVVGFGAGWVVTAGAKEQAVRTATVDRIAGVCAVQARGRWQAQGEELGALRGWANRETRETLAREVTVALGLEEALQGDVTRECGRLLDA